MSMCVGVICAALMRVSQAASTLVDENGEATERPLKDPGLILKYSTHKNMASMSAEKGDIKTAMEHYLQVLFFIVGV